MQLKNNTNDIPAIWYKYFKIDNNFYNSIVKSYLWFSDPSTFNDPYDFNISFDYSCDEHVLRAYYKKLSKLYNQRSDDSMRSFDLEKRISEFKRDPKGFIDKIKQFTKDIISKNYGVCCFSECCDNLLMWSHYADKHQGTCLAFKSELDIEFFNIPFVVQYPDKYPRINYLSFLVSKLL